VTVLGSDAERRGALRDALRDRQIHIRSTPHLEGYGARVVVRCGLENPFLKVKDLPTNLGHCSKTPRTGIPFLLLSYQENSVRGLATGEWRDESKTILEVIFVSHQPRG
jgi:hypothetical protein